MGKLEGVVKVSIKLACAAMLAVSGVLVLVFGFNELELGCPLHQSPHALTCQELGLEGPSYNAHVVLTDFILHTDKFWFETHPTTLWIPLTPGDATVGSTISVILKSTHATTSEQVLVLAEGQQIDGIANNAAASLTESQKKLMRDFAPGYYWADFDKLWILEYRRAPRPRSTVIAILLLGTALLLKGGQIVRRVLRRPSAPTDIVAKKP